MAIDAALWLIVAAGITFIWYGCKATTHSRKPLYLRAPAFHSELDKAA